MVAKTAATKSRISKAARQAGEAVSEGATVTKVLRRKELAARIAKTSGAKPKAVKAVLDATLKELGDAIAAGEAMNLPGLGRVVVNRKKEGAKGDVIICKIRRKLPGASDGAAGSGVAPEDQPEAAGATVTELAQAD